MGDLREELIRLAEEWEGGWGPGQTSIAIAHREHAARLRSLLASHPAPSPRSEASSWMPGGAFCHCGEVEFMVPGVPTVRTTTRGVALPTVHTPVECRSATWDEVSNLGLSSEPPAGDPVPAESATPAAATDDPRVATLLRVVDEALGRLGTATKGEEDGR